MKTIKIIILSCILALAATECIAQTLTIKNVSLQPNDQSAIVQPVFDNNGDTCALIKIKTEHLSGIEFPNKNQYVQATFADDTYWVYMPASIGRKLDFSHADYLPIQLDMIDYGYKRLRGGKTYLVTVEAPIKSELKSKVILNVEPKEAHVSFNAQDLAHQASGTYTIDDVAPGNYSYQVRLDDYVPKTEIVTVGKSEAKTLTVKLQPIMHRVKVYGNVKNARIIVDNIDYGKVGFVNLPQGSHHIRITADGYKDFTEMVNINADTDWFHFLLDDNHVVEHIYPTAVTIHSNGTKVYVNNKPVKEWSAGNRTINLIPGKYVISDDLNNNKKIIVETSPIEVTLGGATQSSSYSNSSSYNSSTTNSRNTSSPNYNTHFRSRSGSSYDSNNYNTQRRANESMRRSGTSNTQRRTNESLRRSGTNNTQSRVAGSHRSTSNFGSPKRNIIQRR